MSHYFKYNRYYGRYRISYFCITVFIFEIMFAAERTYFEAAIMDAIYEEVREYVYQLNYWMFNISTAIGMVLGALLY